MKPSLLIRHPADTAGNNPHFWLVPNFEFPSYRRLPMRRKRLFQS